MKRITASGVKDAFDPCGVEGYERTRYRRADQRFVDRRERRILRRFLRRAGASGLVLDVPCGYGRFSGLLLEHGFGVVGCDLSLSMVKKTMSLERPGGVKLRGTVGDAVKGLPFKTASFAGAFCVRLFHHLHDARDREAALRELARAARSFVVVSYYRRNFLHQAQRFLRRRLRPSQAFIRMASRAEFLESVAAAGMRVVCEAALLPGMHAQSFVLLGKVDSQGEVRS